MFSFIGGRISQRGQKTVLLYFGEVKHLIKSSSSSTTSQRQRFKLTTVVSGFAKPKNGKYIPASILHGKVGEDAYFKVHYVGEFCEDKPFAAAPAYVLVCNYLSL